MKYEALTEQIIKAFYKVYNTLGYEFLEKVYENALFTELISQDFKVEQQKRISVYYNQVQVGNYLADLLVNELVIVELKAQEVLAVENEYQLINYLKATDIEVGLLLNFGKQPAFKRKVFDNKLKKL